MTLLKTTKLMTIMLILIFLKYSKKASVNNIIIILEEVAVYNAEDDSQFILYLCVNSPKIKRLDKSIVLKIFLMLSWYFSMWTLMIKLSKWKLSFKVHQPIGIKIQGLSWLVTSLATNRERSHIKKWVILQIIWIFNT
jgi:hypothetical protein